MLPHANGVKNSRLRIAYDPNVLELNKGFKFRVYSAVYVKSTIPNLT